MTKETSQKIESSPRFQAFLIRFGVHGIEEYKTFTKQEQIICIREYLKDLSRKN